jgi:hypothetical protein
MDLDLEQPWEPQPEVEYSYLDDQGIRVFLFNNKSRAEGTEESVLSCLDNT